MNGIRTHPNALYQATVEALEAVLPPRVVSRALKEGLTEVSRDPSTLSPDDLEPILKGTVFRHLQVTAPVDQAKATVVRLLEELRAVGAPSPRATGEAAAHGGEGSAETDAAGGGAAVAPAREEDRARLADLAKALRPFNLYFDWPEVRKLRAQLQAAEAELEAGRDLDDALDEAAAQVRVVEQKLEDRLVLQARELGELEEALELVQPLGGPRVRRLEALIGQVRQAQRDRTLAEAEIERGRRLARDLRKLMESSVAEGPAATEPARPDGTAPAETPADEAALRIDRDRLSPEVSERLLAIDLDAEAKELAEARAEHAELVRYLPSLEARFAALESTLQGRASIAAELRSLRATLADAATRQRAAIEAELDAVARDIGALHHEIDTGSLERAVRVTRDVLAEGLPDHSDLVAIRDLHRSALERSDELTVRDRDARNRAEAQLRVQAEALERLALALERAAGAAAPSGTDAASAQATAARDELAAAHEALAAATAEGRAEPETLERALRAEAAWERSVAEGVDDERERLRARLRELQARLAGLPELGSLPARTAMLREELARAQDADAPEPEQVDALASLVEGLRDDARAEVERRLDLLGKEAGDAAGTAVLRELQEAARTLAAGRFPDLAHLRSTIEAERAAARERDGVRLARLQGEATRLESSGVPAAAELVAALTAARRELEAGRSARRPLDDADRALEATERQRQARLDAFPGRLDAALARFRTVERLNNDDVAAARRILTHLDSQRAAIARVSPGLQHQLASALGEAEGLLDGLGEAFEATRAVADQLVAGGMLDDVLGFFGGTGGDGAFDGNGAGDGAVAGGPDGDATMGAAAPPAATAIDEMLSRYRRMAPVRAAAVVDRGGGVVAGDLGDAPTLAAAVATASARWDELARHLETGTTELVSIDAGAVHVLIAPLSDHHAAVVLLDAADAPELVDRVRIERDALRAAVRPPA